jgi:hypothetical protein
MRKHCKNANKFKVNIYHQRRDRVRKSKWGKLSE